MQVIIRIIETLTKMQNTDIFDRFIIDIARRESIDLKTISILFRYKLLQH